MIKTLRITFSLGMTMKINAVLYALKHIPLLGRCFPDDVYRVKWLKGLAAFAAFFWELSAAFFGKLLYFAVMIGLACLPYDQAAGPLFGHFLVFLTIVGGLLNGYLFDADEAADQAVLLLGMEARKYTLVKFGYALTKVLLGFAGCSLVCGGLMGAPLWLCLLVPLYVIGVKLTAGALRLKRFRGKEELEVSPALNIAISLGGLALAYGLPALGFCLPVWASGAVMVLGVVTGILSIRTIASYRDYRFLRQQLRNQAQLTAAELEENTVEASRNQISDHKGVDSHKKGFAYLNDLFFQRHRKLFGRPSAIVSAIAAAAVTLLVLVLIFAPELQPDINKAIMDLLPATAFLMYLINRGSGFTQALFINCDRSLFCYSFFKRRDYILKLFTHRLLSIIRVNLIPALAIAAGLPLLLWVSGGTEDPLNYGVLSVTVLALSVFFSVHYLTLYYLLQPYTSGTAIKNPLYSAITGGTYVVCYMLLDVEGLSAMNFGLCAIGFSLLYCLVALVLVYFLAPKTFRVRV